MSNLANVTIEPTLAAQAADLREKAAVGDVVTVRCATNYTVHTGPVVELRDRRDLFGRVRTEDPIVVVFDPALGRNILAA